MEEGRTTQGQGAGAVPSGDCPHAPVGASRPGPMPGPDVQRLGRWAALGVVVAIAAIFVVLILSAMR